MSIKRIQNSEYSRQNKESAFSEDFFKRIKLVEFEKKKRIFLNADSFGWFDYAHHRLAQDRCADCAAILKIKYQKAK